VPHDLELLSDGELARCDGWYVVIKDHVRGPLAVDDLADRWSRGKIGTDTLCWREGMGEWRPLSRLHNLAVTIAPRPREGHLDRQTAAAQRPPTAPRSPAVQPAPPPAKGGVSEA
jgi:hypothetical protein